jgi:hypothetical protein
MIKGFFMFRFFLFIQLVLFTLFVTAHSGEKDLRYEIGYNDGLSLRKHLDSSWQIGINFYANLNDEGQSSVKKIKRTELDPTGNAINSDILSFINYNSDKDYESKTFRFQFEVLKTLRTIEKFDVRIIAAPIFEMHRNKLTQTNEDLISYSSNTKYTYGGLVGFEPSLLIYNSLRINMRFGLTGNYSTYQSNSRTEYTDSLQDDIIQNSNDDSYFLGIYGRNFSANASLGIHYCF